MNSKDQSLICGIDEVGRGPLAGPVVAAAVTFPSNYKNKKIKDSKKLSKKNIDNLSKEIKNESIDWAIVSISNQTIDHLNIRRAAWLAMSLASNLVACPDLYLVDGNMNIATNAPQKTVVKGDSLILQISAASIIAKCWRDNYMLELAKKYPKYGFEKHVGYPTKDHKRAIIRFGPCPYHRTTFSGVKQYCSQNKKISPLSEPAFALCKTKPKGFYIPENSWPNWRAYSSKIPYQQPLLYLR